MEEELAIPENENNPKPNSNAEKEIKLSSMRIDKVVIDKIPSRLAREYLIMPVSETEEVFTIAMANIWNLDAIDEVRLLVGKTVLPVKADPEEINETIKKYYGLGSETMEQMVKEGSAQQTEEETKVDIGDEKAAEDATVVQFVNQIITEAVKERASDIHVEPMPNDLRIRFRVDGVLREIPVPTSVKHFRGAIITRLKVMADMNIAEHRIPQDGRIGVKVHGHDIDLRVSAIPIADGEGIVMRILDKSAKVYTLSELGMLDDMLKVYEGLAELPNGIILVTGPTGSGKSTTLYAILSKINSAEEKIITVEDPVEYQMTGINQIAVQPKIGLTFAKGLRAILRQDPDIVMVGEIRDFETAEIAIRASLTGHLVFSTIHTNDASSAVTRLVDMGIEPYLVASSLEGILAQRLVRKICEHCKEEFVPSKEYIEDVGIPFNKGEQIKLYRGKGCKNCFDSGYYGRLGIYELLVMNEKIEPLILERSSSSVIKRKARELGMMTLREEGWRKVKLGLTSVEEVLRETQRDEDIIEGKLK